MLATKKETNEPDMLFRNCYVHFRINKIFAIEDMNGSNTRNEQQLS